MDFSELLSFLASQPLLALALAAIFVTVLGGLLRGPLPLLGGFIRGVGNLGLVAALLLTVAQATRLTSGTDFALPGLELPELGLSRQSVSGGETRVPMKPDGHFWVHATINGVEGDFLVDTGATLTAISPRLANAAEVRAQPLRQNIAMRTANGTVAAQLGTVDELRFGSVVARQLDVVVAPGLEDQNVIGMNLLSRLASWRVEGRTLILVPHHPQAET